MTGTVEGRLAALGITLPAPAAPIANYVGFNFAGPNLLVVSGQIPLQDGKILFTGKVGAEVSLDDARAAARMPALTRCGCGCLAPWGWTRTATTATPGGLRDARRRAPGAMSAALSRPPPPFHPGRHR